MPSRCFIIGILLFCLIAQYIQNAYIFSLCAQIESPGCLALHFCPVKHRIDFFENTPFDALPGLAHVDPLILSLAQPDPSATLAKLRETPALQTVLNGAEPGEVLPLDGVSQGAWAFSAAVLALSSKDRPTLVVCPTSKLQEQLQRELETWLPALTKRPAKSPLFFPAWNVLPHEARLPHADVLSERLETLIHLAKRQKSSIAPVIVTTAVALLQRTFSPAELKKRFRRFKLGQRIAPLDLVEWLEDQGYEPEAQVSQKGELALRGGILDVFPLASPWPVRFEFFGDEIESLRTFDPQTQISREKIDCATISPGGELGILKQQLDVDAGYATGRLDDYLTGDPLCLLIEPDDIAKRIADYLGQVPSGDLLHDDWQTALGQARERGTIAEVRETGEEVEPPFESLEAYRPLGQSLGDPQIAGAERREFFNQLHRWLRNGYPCCAIAPGCCVSGQRGPGQALCGLGQLNLAPR